MKLFSFKLLTLIIFFSIGCTESNVPDEEPNTPDESFSGNSSSTSDSELMQAAYRGDVKAYQQLRTTHLDYPPMDFIFWAMMMANKNDYPPAYYDVYYKLKNSFSLDYETYLDSMDTKSRYLALSYLFQGAKLEDKSSMGEWQEFKDKNMYRDLMILVEKADSLGVLFPAQPEF